MAYARRITTIRGKRIALTGHAWTNWPTFAKLVRSRGGRLTPNNKLTDGTNILVRGYSPHWLRGNFGQKEIRLARMITQGTKAVLIPDDEFRELLEHGRPARTANRVAGQPVSELLRAAAKSSIPKKERKATAGSRKLTQQRHRVNASLDNVDVTRAGTSIRLKIYDRKTKLGELEIGRGSMFWWGAHRQTPKRLWWGQVAKLLNKLAYGK